MLSPLQSPPDCCKKTSLPTALHCHNRTAQLSSFAVLSDRGGQGLVHLDFKCLAQDLAHSGAQLKFPE